MKKELTQSKLLLMKAMLQLVASGTEVELALKVQKNLKENNIHSKVVSMPCMELFDKQSEDYKKIFLEENSINFYYRSWKYFILAKIYKK